MDKNKEDIYRKEDLERQFVARIKEQKMKFTLPEAKIIVTEMFEAMKDLIYDKGLIIVGFEEWLKVEKGARVARNPRTGEKVKVDSKTIVKNKLAKRIKNLE